MAGTGACSSFVTDNLHPTTVLTATLLSLGSLPGVGLQTFGIAAPGCQAYIDPVFAAQVGLSVGNTTHSVPFAVPGGFTGFQIFAQAAQIVPGANNADVTTTNAICLSLGSQ